MLGLSTLDVLIGLVTVYLTFGIACTAIVDAVAGVSTRRSRYLDDALRGLLAGNLRDSEPFIDAFYGHPLLQTLNHHQSENPSCFVRLRRKILRQSHSDVPSFVPQEMVGRVVADIVMAGDGDADKSLKNAIAALPGSENENRIKALLQIFVNEVGEDSIAFKNAVETQFSAAMDRTSARFKIYAQLVALLAAAILVVGSNADTIAISRSLSLSTEARAQLVQDARKMVVVEGKKSDATTSISSGIKPASPTKESAEGIQPQQRIDHQGNSPSESIEQAQSVLESTGLQIGWHQPLSANESWAEKICGLLVSIFAVSLGAPFWFKVLQRFMQTRDAVATLDKASPTK